MNCVCPDCGNLIYIDLKPNSLFVCDVNSLCDYCGIMMIITPNGIYTEDQYTNGVE